MNRQRVLILAAIPLFIAGQLVRSAAGDSEGRRWLALVLVESALGLLIVNGVVMLCQTLRELKDYKR